MDKIKINTQYIKLSQFLKWSNLVTSGAEAKLLIQNEKVKVNGKIELQRGKKIIKGDIIQVDNKTIQVD